jgi:hypothetical protein
MAALYVLDNLLVLMLSLCLIIYCFDAKEGGRKKSSGILCDNRWTAAPAPGFFVPRQFTCWVHALLPHLQLLDAPKVVKR